MRTGDRRGGHLAARVTRPGPRIDFFERSLPNYDMVGGRRGLTVVAMDLLDLFDRDDDHRRRGRDRRRADRARDDDDHDDHRGRHHDDDDDDRDDRDDDRDDRRFRDGRFRQRNDGGPRRSRWSRRAHPHLFSWLLLGGGVVLLGLALIAALSALGLWDALASAYLAAGAALLPGSWHDEWHALPGVVHVALVLGALFVAAGVLGELVD